MRARTEELTVIYHGQKYTLSIKRVGRKGCRICEVCGIPADSFEQRFLDEMRSRPTRARGLKRHRAPDRLRQQRCRAPRGRVD